MLQPESAVWFDNLRFLSISSLMQPQIEDLLMSSPHHWQPTEIEYLNSNLTLAMLETITFHWPFLLDPPPTLLVLQLMSHDIAWPGLIPTACHGHSTRSSMRAKHTYPLTSVDQLKCVI